MGSHIVFNLMVKNKALCILIFIFNGEGFIKLFDMENKRGGPPSIFPKRWLVGLYYKTYSEFRSQNESKKLDFPVSIHEFTFFNSEKRVFAWITKKFYFSI